MTKYLLLLLLSPGLSHAADDLYHYKSAAGCVLKKFENNAWKIASFDEVAQESFALQTSPANPQYANFKFRGKWYTAKTFCFDKTRRYSSAVNPSANNTSSPRSITARKGHVFIEPELSYFLLTGGNTKSGTGTFNGVTETVSAAKASMGISGKLGYYLNDTNDLYLELGSFSINQANTVVDTAGNENDKIFTVGVGYQHFFTRSNRWTPFLALALNYDSLSGSLTVTTNSISYTAKSVGGYFGVGTLYALSPRFCLTGTLNYVISSFSSSNITISNVAADPVGATIASNLSYSRVGLNLGLRYDF